MEIIKKKFAIIFHGGAGKMSLTQESLEAREKRLTNLLKDAYHLCQQAITENNLTALDIVERLCVIMEDDETFNAGKGSVLTDQGEYELEASIMDGKTLKMGSVGLITKLKNPIILARDIMENTPHIALFGDGAQEYAEFRSSRKTKHVIVDASYYHQRDRYQAYLKSKDEFEKSLMSKKSIQNQNYSASGSNLNLNVRSAQSEAADARKHRSHANLLTHLESEETSEEDEDGVGNTVGVCVMLNGDLAAATSTGGLNFKMKGRIGDTPINGSGNYANNMTCAISGTGKGEEFMRHLGCFNVHARMAFKGLSLKQAMDEMIKECFAQDTGGFVGVDKNGDIAISFNTIGMNRGYVTSEMNGIGKVAVFQEERTINLND